ncbi:MAG: CvpA family protein [Oscillospiraceae bacterium]|nr:CvpA family protein [Oscillospiraceae bacterium]
MNILIDVMVVVFIGLMVFLGYKKGFIASMIELFGYILSCLVAWFLSGHIGRWIWSSIIRGRIIDTINASLPAPPANIANLPASSPEFSGEITAAVNDAFSQMPGFVSNFLNNSNLNPAAVASNIQSRASGTVSNAMGEIAPYIADNVVEDIVLSLIVSIAFVALFIICGIVFKILARLFKSVNKIPFIGNANKALGAMAGLIKATLFVFAFTAIINIFIKFIDPVWMNTLQDTHILSLFYNYNPLGV